jgi:hypothetical protein
MYDPVVHLAALMFIGMVVSVAVGQILDAFGHILLPILGFVAVGVIVFILMSLGKGGPEKAIAHFEVIALIMAAFAVFEGAKKVVGRLWPTLPSGLSQFKIIRKIQLKIRGSWLGKDPSRLPH